MIQRNAGRKPGIIPRPQCREALIAFNSRFHEFVISIAVPAISREREREEV